MSNEQIRRAVTDWMNSQGIRNPEELGQADYEQVKRLLGSDRPAFGIFLSMVMFERQKAVMQLTNADLSNSQGAVTAAKLQGIVLAVDTMRELILNIADPIGEGSDLDQREVAGVRFNGERSEQPAVG
jgi:hypothetical protein